MSSGHPPGGGRREDALDEITEIIHRLYNIEEMILPMQGSADAIAALAAVRLQARCAHALIDDLPAGEA
ncbi:hypothetical protein [Falsiroseomonas sp. CW058]|uniref:hypothetical protein n=1 Tax=Falsiroseomonas sp. CW058 TaxID=3388664 RepID=UPI003D31126C